VNKYFHKLSNRNLPVDVRNTVKRDASGEMSVHNSVFCMLCISRKLHYVIYVSATCFGTFVLYSGLLAMLLS